MSIMDTFRSHRDAKATHAADQLEVDALVEQWRAACEQLNLGQQTGNYLGAQLVTPRIVDIVLGPPLVFVARLLPGQEPNDIREVAGRIARHIGGRSLRVADLGFDRVRIELVTEDTLTKPVALSRPLRTNADPVVLGRDETGKRLTLDLRTMNHGGVAGATGSGKSMFSYGIFSQLAATEDITVVGSDVTGLLLAPWADRQPGRIALGLQNPMSHVLVLERLVVDMVDRIDHLPAGRDQWNPEDGLVVCAIEETAGLMRALQSNKELLTRATAAIGRLLAESRKAGYRVFVIAQRFDVKTTIDGYGRSQIDHAISFRTDAEGLKMLHGQVDSGIAEQHLTEPAGVALYSAPGRPLTRFRAPFLDYSDYCRMVNPAGQENAA